MDQRRYGLLLGAAAVTALAASAAGTTRYVNGSCGNNGWTGTSPVCAAPDGPKATIQAGIDASPNLGEIVVSDGVYTGLGNRDVTVGGGKVLRSANGPSSCVIDCQGAGRGLVLGTGELQGLTIINGIADRGGAVFIEAGDVTLRDCIFLDNEAEIGGALYQPLGSGGAKLFDCTFSGNRANVGAGALAAFGSQLVLARIVFAANDGNLGPGAVAAGNPTLTTCVNCSFSSNIASFVGGGIVAGGSPLTVVNTVFSNNTATHGGGIDACCGANFVNCTFFNNQDNAVGGDGITVRNCVLWGNAPEQIEWPSSVVMASDVQGGWPGTGNIDSDPLFVQPGTDDLRLSFGSLCVNAGSNAALPPDTLDLDGDGNTAEPIPFDLAGAARVQDGTVDMGASEGQFAPGAPASSEGDLDQGEFAVLVPEGGPLDPLSSPAVILTNVSGSDNGEATVTQIDGAIHPSAGGYSDLGSVLVLETSIQGGDFLATVLVPFDSNALGGAAPQQVRATWYDASAGNWALAVWGDVNDSPGFPGAIGQRIYAEAPAAWGLTQNVGDHGVFWDPKKGKGFAWANVDHASDFGVGVSSCPGDCLQTPDGKVSVVDLLRLIGDWGSTAGGPCDVDADGVIGAADLAALLGTWGPCTVPAMPAPGTPGRLLSASAAPAGSADLDASGAVDRADLELLQSCWGAQEPGCPADLDGDGTVGVRDYLGLLAAWSDTP